MGSVRIVETLISGGYRGTIYRCGLNWFEFMQSSNKVIENTYFKRFKRSEGPHVVPEGGQWSAAHVRTESQLDSSITVSSDEKTMLEHADSDLEEPDEVDSSRNFVDSDDDKNDEGPSDLGSEDEADTYPWCLGSDSLDSDDEYEAKPPEDAVRRVLMSRFRETWENIVEHDYFEPAQKCRGIEENERLRLPSGGTKMARDFAVGDCVLGPKGEVCRVKNVKFVTCEVGCELTRNTNSLDPEIYARQRVVVGAAQHLEMVAEQASLEPQFRNVTSEGGFALIPRWRNLVEDLVLENNIFRRITKLLETNSRIEYSSAPERNSRVTTKEEAEQIVRAKLDKIVPKNEDGAPKKVIHWYPEARDVVRYRIPEDATSEYSRIEANIKAMSMPYRTRGICKVLTGVVAQSPDSGLSPERLAFDEAASHLSKEQLKIFWYLAGAWVGDGDMKNPMIYVDSIDRESMLYFADCAHALGLHCDLEYDQLPQEELERYWNQHDKKTARVHLAPPSQMTNEESEKFSCILRHTTERARKAQEWREEQAEQKRLSNECGKLVPEKNVLQYRIDEHGTAHFGTNPYWRRAASIIIFDGYKGSLRVQTKSWLWQLFMKAQIRGNAIEGGKQIETKTGPQWLITSPVEWREAFLAGLTESDGNKKEDNCYRIKTIYPELCDLVVAIARSLAVSASVYRRKAKKYTWDDDRDFKLAYDIYLREYEPLWRIMRHVASPRKKPDEGWTPNPEWVLEPSHVRFAVSLLRKLLTFVLLEVEGHRTVHESGLVIPDAYMEVQVKDAGQFSPHDKSDPDDGHCVSCFATKTNHWHSGWDFREGWICDKCQSVFSKVMAHCTECMQIPKVEKFRKLQPHVRTDDSGRSVFPCPNCSVNSNSQYTLVHSEPYDEDECYSCHKMQPRPRNRSWCPREGRLCLPCHRRWCRSRMYCPTCRLVPYPEDLNKAADKFGRVVFLCRGCESPLTLQLTDKCFSCHKFSRKLVTPPSLGEKLCLQCYERFRRPKVCCKRCGFIPYVAQLSLDSKFASSSICWKCRNFSGNRG